MVFYHKLNLSLFNTLLFSRLLSFNLCSFGGKNTLKNINFKMVLTNRRLIGFVAVTLLITLGLLIVFDLRSGLASIPLSYTCGDNAATLFRSHEMFFDHTLFTFDSIGVSGSNAYGAYPLDFLLLLIQFFFALICPTYILAYNLFILLGFYLVGYSCYYSLRRLKINYTTSIILTILYTFLPYHLERALLHSYLAMYFVAPLAIVIALEILSGKFKLSLKNPDWILLIIIGSTGIYYSFFSCFYFFIAALFYAFSSRKVRNVLSGLYPILLTILGLLISAIPDIIYFINNGTAGYSIARSPLGADIYSLKISHLIMPRNGHRIAFLANLKDKYMALSGANESSTSALGLVLTLGFLAIILSLFFIINSSAYTKEKSQQLINKFKPLAYFLMLTLLISTVGSFSTFLCFIIPQIRAYCRICVFIAFICVIALSYLLDYLSNYITNRHKKCGTSIYSLILVFILVLGFTDQSCYGFINNKAAIKNDYDRDQAFVDTISSHDINGDDKVVAYFMPYMFYPENGQIGNYPDYSPLLLCIHNESLVLSYGTLAGSSLSTKLFDIYNMDMYSQTEYAKASGYDGILIAFDAYDEDTQVNRINLMTSEYGAPVATTDDYAYWSF